MTDRSVVAGASGAEGVCCPEEADQGRLWGAAVFCVLTGRGHTNLCMCSTAQACASDRSQCYCVLIYKINSKIRWRNRTSKKQKGIGLANTKKCWHGCVCIRLSFRKKGYCQKWRGSFYSHKGSVRQEDMATLNTLAPMYLVTCIGIHEVQAGRWQGERQIWDNGGPDGLPQGHTEPAGRHVEGRKRWPPAWPKWHLKTLFSKSLCNIPYDRPSWWL